MDDKRWAREFKNGDLEGSCSRMRGVIGFSKPFYGDVSIDLRCGKIGVAQEGLNASQIGPVIQQMSGETMPQFVWTNTQLNGSVGEMLLEHQPYRACRHSFAKLA
jgi:hypothetical protein